MELKSKIVFFLIAIIITLSVSGCKKNKNDVIPDVYVDFYLDIKNDIVFRNLSAVSNYVVLTSQTPSENILGRLVGYDNNGIIVYCTKPDEFSAYDRTCPHDFFVNGLSIKVNVEGFNAICPQCGTTYALYGWGNPTLGPSRYALKNYKTSFDGQYIHIWHH